MAAAAGTTTTFDSTSATTIASSFNVTYSSTNILPTLRSIEEQEEIIESYTVDELKFFIQYLSVIVCLYIGFCLNSLMFNIIIVVSSLWIKKSLSTNLSFIISLAGADTYNSLLIGKRLFIHIILPFAFDVDILRHNSGACFALLFQMLIYGAILTSVAHVFILSLNNYLRILWNINITPRTASLIIALVWSLPLSFFSIYFVSIENQGFRSDTCDYLFLQKLKFRLFFVILFYLPFVFIFVMYIHIYFVQRGNCQCIPRCIRIGRPFDEGNRDFSMRNISGGVGVHTGDCDS